jgi:hypothetical protein
LEAARKLSAAMVARKQSLSLFGAQFVLALYEAGKDDAAEAFLDSLGRDRVPAPPEAT